MLVTPACDLVSMREGKISRKTPKRPFIVCNKQVTGKDDEATIRYFGSISKFMAAVMAVCIFLFSLNETPTFAFADG
jgi:hypothetical protein